MSMAKDEDYVDRMTVITWNIKTLDEEEKGD